MIAANSISLAYGAQRVLDGVSLTLDSRSRAGLVGANGSGKTTLMRILAGHEEPEEGSVTRPREMTFSYLPQRSHISLDMTVYEAAESGFQREFDLLRRRNDVAESLKTASDGQEGAALLQELANLDHDLEESGVYHREPEIAKVLKGLGFHQQDDHRPLKEFSGGWRMRVALARTLLSRPDFLLLDEPTNYLDTEARLWLAGFLKSFPGGVLIVSHDRAFLDDTVTEILELFLGKVKRYRGGYTSYESQREAELEQLVAAWEQQQKELAKQEDFIRRFRAKATKAKQVQSRIKMLEKEERIEIPEHLRPINIKLPPATHSGSVVVEAEVLTKWYSGPSQPVIDELTLSLTRGSRLAVLGRNGAGKSTLLRILGGHDEVSSGRLAFGKGVEVAYFGQDTPDSLPGDVTVLEYVSSRASSAALPMVRDVLGAFLFSGDSVEKTIRVLSGGERSRVAMASLLLRPANLLVLDEPTNHLDMTSQQVLANALSSYDGTVVFVSHDRYFIREVATDVLALWPLEQRPDGRHPVPSNGGSVPARGWQLYPGSYREFEKSAIGRVFEEATAQVSAATGASAGGTRGRGVSSGTETSASGDVGSGGLGSGTTGSRALASGAPASGDKQAGNAAKSFQAHKEKKAELRKLQKREAELLTEIESLESEHGRIQERMASEEVYLDPGKLRAHQEALERNEQAQSSAHEEWEAVTEALARVSTADAL